MIALALLVSLQEPSAIAKIGATAHLSVIDDTGQPTPVDRFDAQACILTASAVPLTRSFDLRHAESVELEGENLRVRGAHAELSVTASRVDPIQDQAMQNLVKAVHAATLACLGGDAGS